MSSKKIRQYVIKRAELEKYLFYYNVTTEDELYKLLAEDYGLTLIIIDK